MSYRNTAERLKNNIQIMSDTLKLYNLHVLNVSCKIDDCIFLDVEFESITGSSIPHDLLLEINLYNENDELCFSDKGFIFFDEFTGYDTKWFVFLGEKHLIESAAKGRLFACDCSRYSQV